jgi:hypothetical protein
LAEKRIKIIYDVETVDVEKADAIFKRIAASTDKADKEIRDFSKDSKKAGTDATNAFKKTNQEADKLNKNLKSSEKGFVSLSNVGVKAGAKIGASLAAAFTVGAAIALGKKIFDITAEFQKFDAVLTNSLGSQRQAQGAMAEIAATAAGTNFSVQELTDSYIKFANRGVKLSQSELMKLADIANSTGKSFDQLSEAVLDAFSGENERLKEFGITAKKTGETTQYTFKGITTEVANTQEAISKYLFSLAELNGVQGTTAAISATLTGRVSNLGDAFDQMFLNIGKGTTGFLPGLISGFTDFINLLAISFKSIKQIEEEASALTLSGDLREDIDEVKALAQAYVKNGRTIEEATDKAAKDVIKSLDNILNGWNVLGEAEEANLKERISNLKKTFVEQKKSVDAEAGLLVKLRAQLKEAQEARENATTVKDINIQNARIKNLQAEIDRLIGVEKQAKSTAKALKKLAGIGYDDDVIQGLDTAAKLYGKIYDEQVTGSSEASKATIKQSDEFINRIDKEIEALATKYGREEELRKLREEKEKAEYQRRVMLAQEFSTTVQDLYSSVVNYQNQLDNQRITRLEANREREIAAAGHNTKERARIELEFDGKIRAIRKKQAEREKRLAIFQAIINTAQGVTAALKLGVPGIILAALVAAAGAIQIAAISNQQIPAYAKGTKSVPGKGNKDTEPAMLTPGEMVIPVSTKKKYSPVLNAIFDNKIDPKILNDIVTGRSGGSKAVIIQQDNKELLEFFKNRPEYHSHLTEDGVKNYMHKGRSRTEYLNSRYSARK